VIKRAPKGLCGGKHQAVGHGQLELQASVGPMEGDFGAKRHHLQRPASIAMALQGWAFAMLHAGST